MADIVPSIVDPEKYIDTNVMGTTKILEIAREKKIKKVCLYSFFIMLWNTSKISD